MGGRDELIIVQVHSDFFFCLVSYFVRTCACIRTYVKTGTVQIYFEVGSSQTGHAISSGPRIA
eukprot:15347038-Ditylum_brightwellii.AAC.1